MNEKSCGEKIFENDDIRCGEWSGGDHQFCKKCFVLQDNDGGEE